MPRRSTTVMEDAKRAAIIAKLESGVDDRDHTWLKSELTRSRSAAKLSMRKQTRSPI